MMTNLSGANLNNGFAVSSKSEGRESPSNAFAAMPKYEAYKESGVDWLGNVPDSWELTRLGTRFFERRAKVSDTDFPPLSVTKQGILPQLENAAKTKDGDNRKLVKSGDFVINSRSDRKGSSGVSDRDGSVSLINIVLEPKGIHPKFSEHLLKSYAFVEEYYRVGRGIVADLWTTRYDDMRTITLAVPSYEEQAAIANFLDQKTAQIDEAIAIKEKQIALLKERKQIIIQKAVTQGRNPDVPMKDSGLDWIGQIPEHWELKKLKYMCDTQGRIGFKGYTTSDLVDEGEGALVFGASHLDWDGQMVLDSPVYISWDKYFESPEIMVNKDDVLIVQRGSTCGKVALVDKDYGKMTINPSLVLLKNIIVNPTYFFLGIKVVLNGILNIISKTAIPMLSQFQIDNIIIPVPPSREQEEIVVFVNQRRKQLDRAISVQETQIEKLKEYKATLINSAVTGKIKVA